MIEKEITFNSILIKGDNWYIILKDYKIIDECVLSFDKKALIEFNMIKEKFIQNTKYSPSFDSIKYKTKS